MQTNAQVETGLDKHTNLWYNTRMTTENLTISDSRPRFNLVPEIHNRGFTMTFANRITVSVRWGHMNYSDGVTTAECAAWNANSHDWVHVDGFDYHGDDVLPRLSTDEVAKFIFNASQMSTNFA